MTGARAAAIRALFAEMGERFAAILDGEGASDPEPPSPRSPRKITDIDKQRAKNIARRMGRL